MTLLATPQELASWRGVEYDETDVAATLALEAACDLVRGYCGQTFELEVDEDVILDGKGTRTLLLPQLPVHDVTYLANLDEDGVPTSIENWYLGNAGVIWLRADATECFGIGHGNIAVTYTHGYDLDPAHPEGFDPLPADLKMCVLQIATLSLSNIGASGVVTGETIGSYQVTYADPGESGGSALPPELVEVLDRYRFTSPAR